MDILFTIYGHDFVYRNYMIFGEIFILECLDKEKKMSVGKMFSTLGWIILKILITIQICKTVVWYNSNINVDKKTLFIKSSYEKGIKVLQDFLDEDCNLLVFEVFKAHTTSGILYVQCNIIVSKQQF